MRLSRKTDYALRVLFFLADRWGRGPVSMTELARENDVPKKFLEHIMLALKSQGWVDSSLGRFGGYVLVQAPEQISIGRVIRYFDGLMESLDGDGNDDAEPVGDASRGRFRRVMLDIRDSVATHLENVTLASVAGNAPEADREMFRMVLLGGEGI